MYKYKRLNGKELKISGKRPESWLLLRNLKFKTCDYKLFKVVEKFEGSIPVNALLCAFLEYSKQQTYMVSIFGSINTWLSLIEPESILNDRSLKC
jgi:hypothetical protein